MLFELENRIILENNYVKIAFAKQTAIPEAILDKTTGNDIRSTDDTAFISLWRKDGTQIPLLGLTLTGSILKVFAEGGEFDIAVTVFNAYFTFELLTPVPQGIYRIFIANAKYTYDFSDKANTGAVGVAMTVNANPTYFPDAKSLETKCQIYPHLGDVGAKYALIIAPICKHREILKAVCATIDRSKGLFSDKGGAFSRDCQENFSNYTMQFETSMEFIRESLPFFKTLGVGQIDFHKGEGTFRQGDFKFARYSSGSEFKKQVSDVLEANGMSAGLHTYSHYICYDCPPILTDPDNLAQLSVLETFTLAEDIDEETAFIPTVESTAGLSGDYGFMRRNTPFILIDNEIIRFDRDPQGFRVAVRGWSETKPACHIKGAKIKHLDGFYHGFTPVLGSQLFYKIAGNIASAYNDGGFKMIYLDALDGIREHCNSDDECWYYEAAFICELLRHCNCDPILEASDYLPSMWAARGRSGAWDTPWRGYKGWNKLHAIENQTFVDRHNAPTLGWYNFYPMTDKYPGNEHTKYHHTDAVDHLGTIAIAHNFSIVHNWAEKVPYERYAALRRNMDLFEKYDALRRAQYFSEDYRQKLLACPYELQLKQKRGGSWSFVEKAYQTAKLFDLNDSARNNAVFNNPFDAQVPFIRIEAMLSTAYRNGTLLLPLNENEELLSQKTAINFGCEYDLSGKLAKVVRVFGNGIQGGKICIQVFCATNSEDGLGEYIIDTDFTGWREFILLESDNGERTDHGFENTQTVLSRYSIYRSGLNNDRTTGLRVLTEGDMTGVRMSDIIAYEHTYEVLKNPTVRIGNTEVVFECELMSTDYIEFDGKKAKVIDRYGNEKPVWFTSNLHAPNGNFTTELTAAPLNRGTPRAQLTIGFTGKEIQ